MPGQKTLDDLVSLTSLEKVLRQPPASAPAQSHDQWKHAEEDWKRLWNGLLTTLIGKKSLALLEPKTLAELSADPLQNKDVVSKMPTVERALDRLLGCIKLERMMEERTFADYRAEVESRFRQVHDEAAMWLRHANELEPRLAAIIDMLDKIPTPKGDSLENKWSANLAISLITIKNALSESQKQLAIIESCFSERAIELAFVDSIRRTWHDVDQSFGTWIRRLLPAVWTMNYGVLVAVSAYLVIGMFLPTNLVLWIGVGFAFAVAVSRYGNTRRKLNDEIRQLQLRYAPALESGKEIVWTPVLKKTFLEAVKPRRDDAQVEEESKSKMPRSVLLTIGTCLTVYLALTALAFLDADLPPLFRAFVNQADSGRPCSIATGTVQWAGPGVLLIAEHSEESGDELTVIAPESISGLTTKTKIEICAPRSNATQETQDPTQAKGKPVLPERRSEVRFPNQIIIPFPGGVTGCSGHFVGDGATLNESARTTLGMVLEALKKCNSIRSSYSTRPSIDVMGFASDKDFSCGPAMSSSQLNWSLAEHRREEVLRELGAVFDEQSQQWKSNYFTVNHTGRHRWENFSMMRGQILYDRENDPIGRYAAIVITDAGACRRLPHV